MEIISIIITIIALIVFILFLYFLYQIRRNEEVYRIQIKWINKNSDLYKKYSYNYMLGPNKSNWYGLKWPKEKHYK